MNPLPIARTNSTKLVAFGIRLLIYACCTAVVFSNKFKANPAVLSNAVLADLLLTAPLAYWLIMRRQKSSWQLTLRWAVFGILVAGVLLPKDKSPLLLLVKTWISPLLELTVVFFLVKKIRRANRLAKQDENGSLDFVSQCRILLYDIFGNQTLANLITSEMSVFYFAFKRQPNKQQTGTVIFTNHRKGDLISILTSVIILLMIETMSVHLILQRWSPIAAWILTGISLYTCLQVWAHIGAIKARPVLVTPKEISIRNGLAGEANIAFGNIDAANLVKDVKIGTDAVSLILLRKTETPNVALSFKSPIEVRGLFGRCRKTKMLVFYVDEPADLITIVNTRTA